LRTHLCELLGIEHPIIQASLGPWSSVELVAAASNAGALGSFGAVLRSVDDLRDELAHIKELTDRPFAVNLSARPFEEEAFRLTIETRPAVISFAHGDPGELVGRAHDADILFVQMINTVLQARQAAERQVDAIIAQGTEATGFGGTVSTMALVLQVVDAVDPIPVVAAGGIADGRGLAAALILGAQGVNIGTRFVASIEADVSGDWKRMILSTSSEDTVKAEFANYVFPPPSREGGYQTLLQVLPTPFVEEWNRRQDEVEGEANDLAANC
jgi:enoyl-[acyl-carrier protein] reductase II